MKKVILITGASGAIGNAIARALSEHTTILQYNNNKPEFASENSLAIKCDLKNEFEIKAMFEEVSKIGRLDCLINNCGISHFSMFQDISLDDWNNVFAVNMTSAFLCAKYAVPLMLYNKSGSIINISSIWGEIGASCEVCYSASKGALITATKALAKELAPSGILVNCVSPGLIESPMNSHLSDEEIKAFVDEIPLGRQGKAEEVAELVKFLAEKNTYITAQNISINGGL